MSFIGCVIIGIGDGFLRLCNFGNLPFTVMSLSAASLVGCSMGAAQLTINIAMFIPGAFFERRRVNIGTLMNAVFVGFASDITVRLAGMAGDMTAFSLRLVFLAAGYAVYCFGCAVFLGADAGCAPYDMINFILVAHTPLSYREPRYMRRRLRRRGDRRIARRDREYAVRRSGDAAPCLRNRTDRPAFPYAYG